MNGGDLIADVLQRQGVRALFTLCGGHISPILVSAKRRGIRVVDVRDEATAVFAADASARLGGVPGVAAVTAGPGLTNTITAVKNAQLAESPLVLLGGATATALKGRGALQDIDQMALMRPHVKRAFAVGRVRDLVWAVEAAFRESREGVPGPVFVECPVDLLYDREVVEQWYGAKSGGAARGLSGALERLYLRLHVKRLFAGAEKTQAGPPAPLLAPAPRSDDVGLLAARLARSERPVVLVGSQAMASPAEVPALAQALDAIGAPVYLSGMARGLLGAAHPLQLRHRRKQALREADLVLLAGTPCDFRLDYGRHIGPRATLVAANRSAAQARRNRRPELAIEGAPELVLRFLAAAVSNLKPRFASWLEKLRARDVEREREIADQAAAPTSEGVNPLLLCREIDRALPDNALVIADGGDFVGTASYVVRPRAPLSWLDPGVFGTLGVGAGFALGAWVARPEAELWILFGDGSFGYSLAEIDSFVRHRVPVVAVIGNDAGWTQIAREQVEVLKDDVGTVLAPTDYHRAAEGLGAKGFFIEKAEDIAPTLAAARVAARAGGPVVVNARLARTDFRKGSLSI